MGPQTTTFSCLRNSRICMTILENEGLILNFPWSQVRQVFFSDVELTVGGIPRVSLRIWWYIDVPGCHSSVGVICAPSTWYDCIGVAYSPGG